MKNKQFFRRIKVNSFMIIPIFFVIVLIGYFKNGLENPFSLLWIGIIVIALVLLISGIQYYSKFIRAPKAIHNLLSRKPLIEFQAKGFCIEDNNKLAGKINGYNVFLAPLNNGSVISTLHVLIPLKIDTPKSSDSKSLHNSAKIIYVEGTPFAEMMLKNYDMKFSSKQLYDFLEEITNNLHENANYPIDLID